MKKLYKTTYFDKEAWIIENFDKLNLNSEEVLLLFLIIHATKNNIPLSYEYLCKKMNKTNKGLDKILSNLVGRHYLSIESDKNGIVFNVDGIFEFDTEKYDLLDSEDVYQTIELVFGRPLSSTELQKTSDLIEKYGQNALLDALRIADARRNLKMPYIEGILNNNEKK